MSLPFFSIDNFDIWVCHHPFYAFIQYRTPLLFKKDPAEGSAVPRKTGFNHGSTQRQTALLVKREPTERLVSHSSREPSDIIVISDDDDDPPPVPSTSSFPTSAAKRKSVVIDLSETTSQPARKKKKKNHSKHQRTTSDPKAPSLPTQMKSKTHRTSTADRDLDTDTDTGLIKVTTKEHVLHLEELYEVPRVWAVPRESTAHLLNLSEDPSILKKPDGSSHSIISYIRQEVSL